MGPRLLNGLRRFVEKIRILGIDGTLPGDDQQFFADHYPAERNTVTREIRTAVHQLVRRLNFIDSVDVAQTFNAVDHQLISFIPDDRINRSNSSDYGLNPAAKLLNDLSHSSELIGRKAI